MKKNRQSENVEVRHSSKVEGLSRRNLLSSVSALTVGTAFSGLLPTSVLAAGRKRVMRIAYLTDTHLDSRPEILKRAEAAYDKAMGADMILLGGDNLMAIDFKSKLEADAQMGYWKRLMAGHMRKPYRAILGNHDVEMWQTDDATPKNGKERTVDLFQMKNRFWSEEMKGWKIIGLDTVHRNGNAYKGMIDSEQMEWLKGELANPKMPVLVCGHIPLITVTVMANSGTKPKDNAISMGINMVAENGMQVMQEFRKAGNVKLALSGHTHQIDRCEYAGTKYQCSGAVSGGWWNGAHEGFAPAFHWVDLYSDGTVETQTVYWESLK